MLDPYNVLGVGSEASQEELLSAYRKLAQQWHPDKHPDNQAEATMRFQEIEEAWRFLSDESQRSHYDDLGEQFEDGLQVAAAQLLMHLEVQLLDAPQGFDHISAINKMLKEGVSNHQIKILQTRGKIKATQALTKKWGKKRGGRNIFVNMYSRQIKKMKDLINEQEKAVEIMRAAEKMLKDYEFGGRGEGVGLDALLIRYHAKGIMP